MQLIPDRTYVSFMRSYPNIIPLSAPAVARIGAMLEPFAFDVIYGAFFDRVIPRGGQGRGEAFGRALHRDHRGRRDGGAACEPTAIAPAAALWNRADPFSPCLSHVRRTATDPPQRSATAAFLAGFGAAWRSVMAYVLIGTYIGIAALAHDFGFSLWWLAASTVLVWAGPAQVILVSALGAGATPVETALAVGLSSVRLLPMVISLLPLIKQPRTRTPRPAAARPSHRRQHVDRGAAASCRPCRASTRIPFSNGLGLGFMLAAQVGGAARLLSRHLAAAAVERRRCCSSRRCRS